MDTQNNLIIAHLRVNSGLWVPMPELAGISGSYNIHTRIDEIRRTRGLRIENRLEPVKGTHRKRSFYRIPSDQCPMPNAQSTNDQSTPALV